MSSRFDGAVILGLLDASVFTKIVVAAFSMRSAIRPGRGTEGTALLVSRLTPFQHAVDPTGRPTDCAANFPLACMETFLCARKPPGNNTGAFASLNGNDVTDLRSNADHARLEAATLSPDPLSQLSC